MKSNKVFNLLVATLCVFFLTACSDDDTIAQKANEIKIGSKKFELKNMVLFNNGTHNNLTNFELYLSSPGLIIDENKDPKGNGNILVLDLYANEDTKLTGGKYVFNDYSNTSFSIIGGFHFLNFDASLGENQTGNAIDIVSGNISVDANNNEYTITITLVDENGTNVIGYYKGNIPILNYDAP
ncbi:hypothetical protein [Tenacibaculum sp.]|uniref:hypothetical protein n=1 Tax=Tenacibaculum sp. TaxID=1906242 RepID=UPI003AA94AB5